MKILDSKLQKTYFDESKHQYDTEIIKKPPIHTLQEIEFITSKIPDKKNDPKIIDFGAGTGRLTIPLLERKLNVSAVDVSGESLSRLENISRELNYEVDTFTSLNEIDRADAVVGTDVLHHVDMEKMTPSIYKVLKKGGKVVFSEPGAYNPFWYIYLTVFHDWEIEKGIVQCSYKNLFKVFRSKGFKKIKIYGLGIFPRALFRSNILCKINDLIGNLPVIKLFAYRYIITATK